MLSVASAHVTSHDSIATMKRFLISALSVTVELNCIIYYRLFGGEAGGFGGEDSPPTPPLDQTLTAVTPVSDVNPLAN